MPDSPRATGTDLKQAILDEARRVLEEQGYTSLSTRRLASAVGCTATSIYLYFKSKDALIYALVEEGFEELNGRMIEAAGGDGSTLERIERASMEYVRFGLERTPYYEIMYTLRAEQMERFPADAYRRARVGLEALAEIAKMSPDRGLIAGTTLWSSLHGLVSLMIAKRIDVSVDRDDLIAHAVRSACACALASFDGEPCGSNSSHATHNGSAADGDGPGPT